ncbi:cytochrome p450, partial [Trifolium pratense]
MRKGKWQIQQHEVWQPPVVGWLKCNVDAGFHDRGQTTNRGWCVRDNTGQFVCAGTAWDIGSHSIIEAEAMAMLEAMKAAIHLHMERVSFESDSLIVVKAVHAKHSGSSEFNLLIDNIKNLLVLNPKFEVKFVKRQANSVAHLLAKAANSWTRRCLFYVIPPC